jgi:O-antigen/teichoic acid export membrane protein
MVAVYMFPAVIYQKFLLPKLHRWAKHEPQTFKKIFQEGNKAMLGLGLVAMLLLWLFGSWAVVFLFGDAYDGSIELLGILSLSAPIIFMAFSAGAMLVTAEHIKRKVKYMGTVALLNIVLNLWLIPDYGAIGASIATVFSNLILLILYYRGAKRYVFN